MVELQYCGKKQIDHLSTPLNEGGNRIQCVEMKGTEPLLLITVYMPCKGIAGNSTEFRDVLDQLSVILSHYNATHRVVIGGDMNEDMASTAEGARAQCLREFMTEHCLSTKSTLPTFVNPAGVEVSTIDYFFYSRSLTDSVTSLVRLDIVITNVSDHYPIELVLAFAFNQVFVAEDKTMPDQTRVNWKKVDHDLYASLVSERLPQVLVNSNSVYDLERAVHSVNHTLAQCAIEAAPRQQQRPRKANLRTWKPKIKSAVSEKKAAFHQWKIAGKPQDEGSLLLAQKKMTSKVLRQLCRKENAQQYIRDKQEILDAKIQDTALFHKLINKHRGSLGVFLNELHVGDSKFRTDGEILQG